MKRQTTRRRGRWQSPRRQRGSETVEFAISATLLFILLFGIIEFSVALYDKAVLTNASREGARTGILFRPQPRNELVVNYFQCDSTPPNEDEYIRKAICEYAENYLISLGGPADMAISVTRSDPVMSPGSDIVVTVDYPYQFLLLPSFVGTISGEILNLSATTTMRAE